DGVHPAAEAVGDDVESGERPVDRRPAGDPLEWGLERGVSILPGIESDTPNADSRDYTEAKGLKCRIIAGTGAITPSPAKTSGQRERSCPRPSKWSRRFPRTGGTGNSRRRFGL